MYVMEWNLLSLEKFRWYFFIFILPLYNAYSSSKVFTAETKEMLKKGHLQAKSESASHSARLLFRFHADILFIISQN